MKYLRLSLIAAMAVVVFSCGESRDTTDDDADGQTSIDTTDESDDFEYLTEQFADIKIIRYKVPGWEKLTPIQQELVYYLYEAALSGRDIIWDQNFKHNLEIRDALENIVKNYDGDTDSETHEKFMTYVKRVWFSNGIHHHYSMDKLKPEFSEKYFNKLLEETNTTISDEARQAIFDPNIAPKRVSLDPEKDLITSSANNLYEGVTEKEVDEYYAKMVKKGEKHPISYGLNSKLVKENGKVIEKTYKVGGMYSPAIEQMVHWLKKAEKVAENENQRKAFEQLIKFYETGDLKIWDDYNIAWVMDTSSVVDVINGFIEVYGDAKGYRGTYESVVSIKDFEASELMTNLQKNVQWFEDNSPIMQEHKKEKVKGVTYKVINVVVESGDASPSTPIGINLPNANWIRSEHGSKSVSLGNILHAYDKASGEGFLEEFAYTDEEAKRAKEHSTLAGKLHTTLHEVVGHASGRLNEGVGTPSETLKNYASTLEEARADLVALYFIMDPKMVELELMPSLEVGKAEYDGYIRNGMMGQLRRLEPGSNIEESHMRNRQLVASWAFKKGKADSVIVKKKEDGKTYFVVNDYDKLRGLFGDLLREIQRIKSEGDYKAGRELVENYGVKVDPALHREVLDRSEKLKSAPYGGFINPKLTAEMSGDSVTAVSISYPDDFKEQMLYYGEKYHFLKGRQ